MQRNTAVALSHTRPDRPTLPAAVSSHPYRAAFALVPHPEAPVAHSWQDWCTACRFLPCQSPVWSHRPRSDTVWVLQAQHLPAGGAELTPLCCCFPQLLLLLHTCKMLTILFPGSNLKSPVSLSKPLKWIYHTTQEFLSEGSSSHKAVPMVTHCRDPGSGSSTAINCLLTHWTKLYFKKMCSAGQSRKPQTRMHFIPQRCIIKEGLQMCVGTALTPY